jgi:hypothetical protein
VDDRAVGVSLRPRIDCLVDIQAVELCPYSMRIDCLVDIQGCGNCVRPTACALIASWTFKAVELCPYSMRIDCLVDIPDFVSLQHAH